MHNAIPLSSRSKALALLAALCALSGCGDAGMFSRGELGELINAKLGSPLDEASASVEHRSSRCSDNVAARCPKGMSPEVEIHVDAGSVIFDFSNVREPGEFDEAGFDGFVLSLLAGSETPILFASVDAEVSNIDIAAERLAHDDEHLELNFAGLAYDSESFVKVDLLLGPLNLLGHGR